ncbi:MAG: methyl-accepting chemotaxis protein [Vogesella sp.]|uniref:methyl-accepting chemotaxis protein n=1 Tax=Vogesella sp. TaxID=1904252 RepID=UPI00391AFD7B
MQQFSLRLHLSLMVGIAILFCMALGATGLLGSRTIAGEVGMLLNSQKMIRQQTEADMMHDAVRSDVLSALYRDKIGEQDKLAAINQDLAEHAKHFRELMADNASRADSPELQQLYQQVMPQVERYLGSAGVIVGGIASQPDKALATLPAFEQDFEALESGMERVTNAIEQSSQSAQQTVDSDISRQSLISGVLALIAALVLIAYAALLSRLLVRPLRQLTHTANQIIKTGNLSLRVDDKAGLELAQSIRAFNAMLASQQKLVAKLQEVAGALEHTSGSIAGLTGRVRSDAETQSSSAEQISAAIKQMSHSVATVSEGTHTALASTRTAGEQARSSGQTVAQATGAIVAATQAVQHVSGVIHSLESSAMQISKVVEAISGIAEQTNLLALNAAIEAARAGESGRGFAVVADEVRNLAVRTSTATAEIQTMVSGIQASAQHAVSAMEDGIRQVVQGSEQAQMAGSAIELIEDRTRASVTTMDQIHRELQEQASASHNIAGNADQVSAMARHTLDSAREVETETRRLQQLAQNLNQTLAAFNG